MKKSSKWLVGLLAAAIAWAPIPAIAEDIDIFTGGSMSASNPSILFVLDNTSNWARQNQKWPGGLTQGQAEANAIKSLLADAAAVNTGINLGLFEFVTEGNANNSGGFVRYPISQMTAGNKAALSSKLTTIYDNINGTSEKRNSNTEYGWLLNDVYNYLTGSAPHDSPLNPNPDAAATGYTTPYTMFKSPITQANGCGRVFMVFISNPNSSGPADDTAANKTALSQIPLGNGLYCSTTDIPLPNFTDATIGGGTTNLGYSLACSTSNACVTTDYAACSDGTYDSCACSSTDFISNAACAAGTQRYMVTKTTVTPAVTTTLGTTSECIAACSTADYAACSDGTSYPGGCACSSSANTCPTGKQRYTVVETTSAGVSSLLGNTSKCKTTPAAWAGEAYVDFPTCIAADNQCSQTGFPTTTGTCPTGTARYLMQDVTTATTSVGATDACYAAAPAASATSLASTCSGTGVSCASPVTTANAGTCVSGSRYMVQNRHVATSTRTVGPTADCLAAAPASVPADLTTACAGGTCATPVANASSGTCAAGTQRYMITDSATTTTAATDACYTSAPAASATSLATTCSGASCITPVAANNSGTCVSGARYMIEGVKNNGAASGNLGYTYGCYADATAAAADTGMSSYSCTGSCVSRRIKSPAATTTAALTCPTGSKAYTYSKTVTTDKGYSVNCTTAAGSASTSGYSFTNSSGIDGSRSSTAALACPGSYKAYDYTWTGTTTTDTNKGYTLACSTMAGAVTTGYTADSGDTLIFNASDTSTGGLACSGGNITGSYSAYNYTKTAPVAVDRGYTLACYSSTPSVASGSAGYTFANTATVSATTSTSALACPTGYHATEITNYASTAVNTTLGTTTACTASAPNTFPDFPTCAGAGISCAAGTPTTTNCPSGKATYTIQGTGAATTTTVDLGYTNTCAASAAAASTSDLTPAPTCTGAGVSCAIDGTRSTTTSTASCAANRYRFQVQGTKTGTITSVPTGTYNSSANMLMADEWARCLHQGDLSPDGTAAKAESFTADFNSSGAIVGADTITFDGVTTTLVGGESPAEIATAVAASGYPNWVATSSSPGIVTFSNYTSGARTATVASDFVIVDAGATGTQPTVVVTTTIAGANQTGGAVGRQNVTTYTIDVYNAQQNATNTALMMSMAQQGGGRYFAAKSEAEILTALKQILSEIQSVNTAFAAASIPLSTTNRSQNLNEVYIGVFRPSLEPRWFGNLKKFKIAKVNGILDLVDSVGTTALNSQTGFLNDCAVSFWTTDSGTWWDQVKIGATSLATNSLINPSPQSTCVAMPTGNTSTWSDMPDGQSVEKGAVAEVIRRGNNPPTTATTAGATWTVNRSIWTRNGNALEPLSVANAGSTDLYNYIRGVDINVDGSHVAEKTANQVRPSVHGDVVHSRPLSVNYGTNNTVIFYGANDGMLRGVDGFTGKEEFAFIPKEFLDAAKQTRLMQNTPYVAFGAVPAPGSTPKNYMFDGSPGLYQSLNNTKVWLFPTQRRGGRMVHALDVTDPHNMNASKLLWYKGCPSLDNDTDCTSDFSDIGQTWSVPVVTKIKGYENGGKPVVIFGGGYDNCEDTDPATNPPSWTTTCASAKGRAVYVLDAESGQLLKKFTIAGMRGVTAGISFVDINNDGYSDYGYVADLGGTIYRLSFINSPTTPTALEKENWSIKKVAYTSGPRKFMFAPAVSFGGGSTVYTAIASGDRERPLAEDYPYEMSIQNYIYAYRDTLDAYNIATTACSLDGDPSAVDACVLDYTTSRATCDSPGILPDATVPKKAWRVGLVYRGEQAVTQPVILGGMVVVNTTRPVPAGQCSAALGEGGGYFVNLINGSGAIGVDGSCGGEIRGTFTGIGLPTDPVVVNLPGEDPILIGAVSKTNTNPSLGSKLFEPTPVRPPISKIKSRKYRYTLID